MSRVRVYRCPECGSTDAGPDESRSAYDFTHMQCNGCGQGGLVDSWQRDFDWIVDIEVTDATKLPSHVSPLEPGMALYDRLAPPEPAPAAGPPVSRAIGCERCYGEDAATAWTALNARSEGTLVAAAHFGIEISACACGQRFAIVFTERVDHRSGEDEMTWLALPITGDEHAELARVAKDHVPAILTKCGAERRFLVRLQAGASVDLWWRDSGFAIDPQVVSAATGPAPAEVTVRRAPAPWILSSDEVAVFWALGVPLEASWLPDDELRTALATRRVKQAVSASSMGTAETYWALASPTDELSGIREDSVVLPPGETASQTPYEDWADDRDVDGVLWQPFFEAQRAALVTGIPPARHAAVVAEYARILAALEERWAEGPKLFTRAPFIDWLRADDGVDTSDLERWLVANNKRSVRHLVQGIRARWFTHDVAAAFDAVMSSAARFKDDGETQRATRMELLRVGAREPRERAD